MMKAKIIMKPIESRDISTLDKLDAIIAKYQKMTEREFFMELQSMAMQESMRAIQEKICESQ